MTRALCGRGLGPEPYTPGRSDPAVAGSLDPPRRVRPAGALVSPWRRGGPRRSDCRRTLTRGHPPAAPLRDSGQPIPRRRIGKRPGGRCREGKRNSEHFHTSELSHKVKTHEKTGGNSFLSLLTFCLRVLALCSTTRHSSCRCLSHVYSHHDLLSKSSPTLHRKIPLLCHLHFRTRSYAYRATSYLLGRPKLPRD